jgi:hypothetical protein
MGRDVHQVQKVLMKKGKARYQEESYSCVKIACAIDSGRGCKFFVTDKYKKDILECMSLLSIPKLGKWQLLKQSVCDRLTLLDSYAKDAAESECDDNSEHATIIHYDYLLCAVKNHMYGELNWKAVRQMCMYSADMDVGHDDDVTS